MASSVLILHLLHPVPSAPFIPIISVLSPLSPSLSIPSSLSPPSHLLCPLNPPFPHPCFFHPVSSLPSSLSRLLCSLHPPFPHSCPLRPVSSLPFIPVPSIPSPHRPLSPSPCRSSGPRAGPTSAAGLCQWGHSGAELRGAGGDAHGVGEGRGRCGALRPDAGGPPAAAGAQHLPGGLGHLQLPPAGQPARPVPLPCARDRCARE